MDPQVAAESLDRIMTDMKAANDADRSLFRVIGEIMSTRAIPAEHLVFAHSMEGAVASVEAALNQAVKRIVGQGGDFIAVEIDWVASSEKIVANVGGRCVFEIRSDATKDDKFPPVVIAPSLMEAIVAAKGKTPTPAEGQLFRLIGKLI